MAGGTGAEENFACGWRSARTRAGRRRGAGWGLRSPPLRPSHPPPSPPRVKTASPFPSLLSFQSSPLPSPWGSGVESYESLLCLRPWQEPFTQFNVCTKTVLQMVTQPLKTLSHWTKITLQLLQSGPRVAPRSHGADIADGVQPTEDQHPNSPGRSLAGMVRRGHPTGPGLIPGRAQVPHRRPCQSSQAAHSQERSRVPRQSLARARRPGRARLEPKPSRRISEKGLGEVKEGSQEAEALVPDWVGPRW